MNSAQKNAASLPNSPWVMDPVTYQLAIQVLEDAAAHHKLSESDRQKLPAVITELEEQYQYALANYKPLDRVPRP